MADPTPSKAEKRYGPPSGTAAGSNTNVDKNSNAYVDPYIEKMQDEEVNNYDTLRKKGFGTDESLYHATNPRGRLFPQTMKDPWSK